MTSVNVTKPRCLVVDNHNYLVTVEDRGILLSRFYLNNLTLIDQTNFSGATFMNVNHHGNAYYIGRNDDSVLVIDSNNLTVVNTLTSPNIRGLRDLIFLQNGQILVLASPDNSNLLFFNRSTASPVHYSYAYNRSTSYLWPHGL